MPFARIVNLSALGAELSLACDEECGAAAACVCLSEAEARVVPPGPGNKPLNYILASQSGRVLCTTCAARLGG